MLVRRRCERWWRERGEISNFANKSRLATSGRATLNPHRENSKVIADEGTSFAQVGSYLALRRLDTKDARAISAALHELFDYNWWTVRRWDKALTM